jgi:hypothetical protein
VKPLIVSALAFLTLGTSQLRLRSSRALKAGAAKVDITLAESELPAELRRHTRSPVRARDRARQRLARLRR